MVANSSNKECPINPENNCNATCAWWSEGQEGCSVIGIDVLLEIINSKFDGLLEILEEKYKKKKK